MKKLLFISIIILFNSQLYGQFSDIKKFHNGPDNSEGVLKSVDIDGDNDLDILYCAGWSGSPAGIYENLGNGAWNNIPIGSGILSFQIYNIDINKDGFEDIVICYYGSDEINWYKNDGVNNFTFVNTILSLNQAMAVTVYDEDGDQNMDLILTGRFDGATVEIDTNGVIDSTFTSWTGNSYYPAYAGPAGVNINVNNDTLEDAVIINAVNGPGILMNNGSGYDPVIYIDPFFPPHYSSKPGVCVAVSDFDNDGDVDIASGGKYQGFYYYECIGPNTYSRSTLPVSGGVVWLLAFDTDNDGDEELVFANDSYAGYFDNLTNTNYQYKGNCFYDSNQNGIYDINESGLSFISLLKDSSSVGYNINQNGNYTFSSDTGSHNITYLSAQDWSLTTDSINYLTALTLANPVIDSLDFGFFPDTIYSKISSVLTGSFPRCNTNVNYWINFNNEGTTVSNGNIHLELDDSIHYLSSSLPPDSIVGNNIYWHYDNLMFYTGGMINIQVQLPSFTSMGDNLQSILTIEGSDSLSSITYSSADTLNQILVCAYDPNDKTVTPIGIGPEGYIGNDQELEYTIRFQNTGNDTAVTIVIQDTLNTNLDFTSLQLLGSSHSCEVISADNGIYNFLFS